MPRRVRDSEISRAVTEVHSRRVQSEPAASGDQNRTAQALLDFHNEIAAEFNIDFANPGFDVFSFKRISKRLNELFVFCAMGKKDFHPVGDPLGQIIAMDRLEWKTSCSQKAAR
jgi:hypothetical protein